ncbi:acyl carrier protein [Murimonas intestini]|uniref:Acyl carrier protein n=1 Tax=Murimonas intestini TaxID=1337051 RepID=A0AB73T4Z3_9FIRM|nr:acyl carrier protein [Murimonas intestini]MCR1840687.1 acyl carrier protein [Murimonas intestini]MCR1865260.1 acyl carrier protein [Murimonas intestini]MCR1883024.1 acyl carrier protein [Murimonas intestini]
MNREEIVKDLQEIFRNLFDDEELVIFDEMTSADIEDWDSLIHINLVSDIELKFNITFTTEEILETKNVGEFIDIIEKKVNGGV